MKKNAVLQLPLNTIVTIIIAFTLLVIGIALLRQFVGGAEIIKEDLDQKTEDQLVSLLQQGQQVAVAFGTQTLKRGSSHLFGVGILNIQEKSVFALTISLSKAIDPSNTEFPLQLVRSLNTSSWVRYSTAPFNLEKQEQQDSPVLISVPPNAPSGTYIFNVNVQRNAQPYDSIKKMYIIVP